jgi:hypothetical protein
MEDFIDVFLLSVSQPEISLPVSTEPSHLVASAMLQGWDW